MTSSSRSVARPRVGERVEDAVGIDAARGVALGRERPVVVAGGVGLLELDHRRGRAELAEPGVRVALVAGRARDAHVPDVEAEGDRRPVGDAGSEQRPDEGDRGRLAGRGQVLDDERRGRPRRRREPLQRVAGAPPARGAARGSAWRRRWGADVAAGRGAPRRALNAIPARTRPSPRGARPSGCSSRFVE